MHAMLSLLLVLWGSQNLISCYRVTYTAQHNVEGIVSKLQLFYIIYGVVIVNLNNFLLSVM